MPLCLGWDIGGAHLKRSCLQARPQGATIQTAIVPFEIWRDPDGLARRLRALAATAEARPDGDTAPPWHAVTMTAELSDVFPGRAEGVRAILRACAAAFDPGRTRLLDLEGDLITPGEAMEHPLRVAAANWVGTALLAGRVAPAAVLIDVGSTTTDIIPIESGRPQPRGRTDTERLMSGELVYSGVLRTPPASLTETVPLGSGRCRVAAENFATTADVYLLLGRLDAADCTAPTADGRPVGFEEAAARLARIVCADAASLGRETIRSIAAHLEERQIGLIGRALEQVLSHSPTLRAAPAVVAGVGAFLAVEVAARAGLQPVPLERLLPWVEGERWGRAAPSAALALLMADSGGAGFSLTAAGCATTGPLPR
jgi:(4-(4-[2-(gamma-L-glutamylamino)ethyl]phenoxymethyl)furan-2-yl)methanamine synthase